MSDKKALFFDIDGTLYHGSQQQIPPSTICVLATLAQDPQMDLYLSTGRSLLTIRPLQAILGYFKGFNLSNGQYIIFDGKVITNQHIDASLMKRLYQYCNEKGFSLGMIGADTMYINFFNEVSSRNFTAYTDAEIVDLHHQARDFTDLINQAWLFATNAEIDAMKPLFPELSLIKWGKYGADIIPVGCSKGSGVAKIIAQRGYAKANTYAFGDGDNDVEMFQNVGTSVVMKEGSPLAKHYANYFAEGIAEDGLAKAITALGLLQKK